jgi:hypothetical protein
MIRTTRTFYAAAAVALCVSLVGLFAPTAQAASISYGNSPNIPPGVMFLDVTESSGTDPVPLFGPPSYFVTGMDFTPTTFVASGAGGGADITDGQLNYTVMSNNGLLGISVFEAGDFSLAGVGGAATQVLAGAIIRATVTQLNGVNIAPVPLLPSSASVAFNLAANPGIVQPWSLGVGLNVAGQVQALFGPAAKATKVDVAIDNSLLAISQPGTIAFIAKKEFLVDHDAVPEPTTAALVGVALCGLGLSAARKRD